MASSCHCSMDLLVPSYAAVEEVCDFQRPAGSRKKTWLEMKQQVRNVRRQLSSISAKIPSFFEFKEMIAENESRFYRIYFLSTVSSGRETTLLYCDVPMDCVKSKVETFTWQPLLESSFQMHHSQRHFSREEQLLWERKRLVIWGITSFDFQPSIGRFVFPASGAVFYCDDDYLQHPPLFPRELKNSGSLSSRLNPQMCPWNPNLVAYINNYDLWVHNILTSCDMRLTYARRGNTDVTDDPVSAGIPSYITQEEFNRFTGFWWQPVPDSSGRDIYRIMYEEVDECDVELLYLPCFGDEKELEVFRFPRAGTSNAKSTIRIVQFILTASHEIEILSDLLPQENLRSVCTSMEYLVRAGWTPDGRYIWVVILDRQQCHEQLVLLPMSSFIPSNPSVDSFTNHVEDSPIIQVIYEERSSVWINVHDVLYFFTQESNREITFLWASEESGYRHLYIITVELLMSSDCEMGDTGYSQDLSKRIKKKMPLTWGEWEVSELDFWVNEKKRLVYFIGLKDTPLERHLYVVDIDNPSEPMRLTTPGYSHNVAMNDECTLFVSIQSSLGQTPFGQVYQIYYSLSYPYKVNVQTLGYFLEPSAVPSSYRQPELFSHRLQSGHLIYGMLFKPPNLRAGEKCPTVLTIYGGPEVQLVTNNFKGMRCLRQYLLSAEGYVVISIDCRGSRHRGVAFESHIKGRLGTVEIADQVEVLLWLSKSTGIIDMSRVAVHGWSYGGYLSLMGLIQRPDIFKVAIAGAPVTSWMLYDTGYTERYMNTPAQNAAGYTSGSVIAYVNDFPDEEDRLLIIHGLRDENVHFTHTSQLINALIKAGKPYQLQVAIAGAPVTSWMLYDTGYTERYMNTPAQNAAGYTSGSVIAYVNDFPDEEDRLLIIHGLRDENVHFTHTSQLINALIKAGKPYQLQIYPTERHSLRHLDTSEHYETTLLSFLQKNL